MLFSNQSGGKPKPVVTLLSCSFLRLSPLARFPALGTTGTFSRTLHRLHVFPRLAPQARFPALCTGCMFSRDWHHRHVFPHFAPVARFPALGTSYMFNWFSLELVHRIIFVYCNLPDTFTLFHTHFKNELTFIIAICRD